MSRKRPRIYFPRGAEWNLGSDDPRAQPVGPREFRPRSKSPNDRAFVDAVRGTSRSGGIVHRHGLRGALRRHRRRRGRVRPHRRVQTPRRGALGGSPGGAGAGGRAMLLHPRGCGPRRLLGVAPRRERRGGRGVRSGAVVGAAEASRWGANGGGRRSPGREMLAPCGPGAVRMEGGYGALADALAKALPEGVVRTGRGVARIVRDGSGSGGSRRTIQLEDGEETPPSRAASSSRCRLGSSPPPSLRPAAPGRRTRVHARHADVGRGLVQSRRHLLGAVWSARSGVARWSRGFARRAAA